MDWDRLNAGIVRQRSHDGRGYLSETWNNTDILLVTSSKQRCATGRRCASVWECVQTTDTVTSVELSIGFVPLFLNIHPLFPLYLLHHSGSVATSLGQVKGDRTITRSKAYPYQEDLVWLVGLTHVCPVFFIQTKERTAPMLNTPPETAVIQSINELLFHPYINQECNPMSSGTSVLPGPGPEV